MKLRLSFLNVPLDTDSGSGKIDENTAFYAEVTMKNI